MKGWSFSKNILILFCSQEEKCLASTPPGVAPVEETPIPHSSPVVATSLGRSGSNRTETNAKAKKQAGQTF